MEREATIVIKALDAGGYSVTIAFDKAHPILAKFCRDRWEIVDYIKKEL